MPFSKKAGLRSSTIRWPSCQSLNTNAPVPTGCLPKSPPAFSTSSFGTAAAKFSATTCRKGALGCESLISSVPGSTARTPLRWSLLPWVKSSKPAITAKKLWPGLCVLGLTVRSNE